MVVGSLFRPGTKGLAVAPQIHQVGDRRHFMALAVAKDSKQILRRLEPFSVLVTSTRVLLRLQNIATFRATELGVFSYEEWEWRAMRPRLKNGLIVLK
jgi:hypothetical protein